MIKIENTEVMGWEAAIRGMRNPMNSWEKSDSYENYCVDYEKDENTGEITEIRFPYYRVGAGDLDLMMRLRNGGTDHRKFMRMITVYLDITAPLYWWKEFDTYKVGTVANSCSTMHKIHTKEFTLEDFSTEHLKTGTLDILFRTINQLNMWRDIYINGYPAESGCPEIPPKDKDSWWQLIQLLPSSYNQRRTVLLNYEVLANMYRFRKDHKLDEWRELCKWVETLPYSEIITGKASDLNEV